MPPAILDPQQSHSSSCSPIKGQISSSFDDLHGFPTGYSTNPHSVPIGERANDVVFLGFGSNSSPSSFSSTMKLNTITGVARPRKTRRRPARTGGTAIPVSSNSARNTGGEASQLGEKLHTWNPFASGGKTIFGDLHAKNSDSVKHDANVFAFGASLVADYSSASEEENVSSEYLGKNTQSVMNPGDFESRTSLNNEDSFFELPYVMGKLDLSSSKMESAIRLTKTEESTSNLSDEKVFIFGSKSTSCSSYGAGISEKYSVDYNVDIFSKLPNGTRKNILWGSENENNNAQHAVHPSALFDNTGETLGTAGKGNDKVQDSVSYLHEEISKLKLDNDILGGEPEKKMGDGHYKTECGNTFIFGRENTQNIGALRDTIKNNLKIDCNSQNVSLQSDSVSLPNLPGKMEKVNLSTRMSFQSDSVSLPNLPGKMEKVNLSTSSSPFVFGSTRKDDCVPEKNGKNMHSSGNIKKKHTFFGGATINVLKEKAFNKVQDPFSDLPDKMRDVKLHDFVTVDGSEKIQQEKLTERHLKDDGNNDFFCGSKKIESTASLSASIHNQLRQGCTIQATAVQENGVPSSNLSNEIQRLKVCTSGAAFASEDARQDHCEEDGGINNFIFGSRKNATASSCADINNQFDAYNRQESHSQFGPAFSVLADKFNAHISLSDENRESSKQDSQSYGVNGSEVFSSRKAALFSSEKSMLNQLPEDMEKLDIKSEAKQQLTDDESKGDSRQSTSDSEKNLYSNNEGTKEGKPSNSSCQGLHLDSSETHALSSVKFYFRADEEDTSSSGMMPPLQNNDDLKPSENLPEPSISFSSSFFAPREDESSNVAAHLARSSERFKSFSFGPVLPPSNISTKFPVTDVANSTITSGGDGTSHMDFKAPKLESFSVGKNNSNNGGNLEFRMKKGAEKAVKVRKNRSKLMEPARRNGDKNFMTSCSILDERASLEVSDDCSPMDYSPYDDHVVDNQEQSREASVASDEFIHFTSQKSVILDENELVSASQHMNTSECNPDFSGLQKDTLGIQNDRILISEENVCGQDVVYKARPDTVDACSDSSGAFIFSSCMEDTGGLGLSFSTSTFAQGSLLSSKWQNRRKDRMKSSVNSRSISRSANARLCSPLPTSSQISNTSVNFDSSQNPRDVLYVTSCEENNIRSKMTSDIKEGTLAASMQECEGWRLRGNEAYASGHLSKAEDYYTRGINSLPKVDTSRDVARALMLCYSNRAATRMTLGRMKEALKDCLVAVSFDPNFLKAQIRAANCYLALGEVADASKIFKKCLQQTRDSTMDNKIFNEATDGLQKSQKLESLIERSSQLLLKRTSTDATLALELVSEALLLSPYADDLMEMKAEALLMLHNYEVASQFCEQSLASSEINFVGSEVDVTSEDGPSAEGIKISPMKIWRWRIMAKSYFHLGKLEDAVNLLQKHEQANLLLDKSQVLSSLSSATVSELLRLKAAGNEAFQAGRHLEAVEHYTAALSCSTESYPFAAICFCNRAAAYQSLGQITDAIADCSLAIALDATYSKAISRRATLHELIRDYVQASHDLRRLISLLEKKSDEDNKNLSSTSSSDLKRARLRLSAVEEEARKGTPMNLYMILCIEPSSSTLDIRKAYRKAALRHHPDKAGQFLVKRENIEDAHWKELTNEVRKDADRLFKTILEAYTTLSDSSKRLQYDDKEEEMRAGITKVGGCSSPRTPSDSCSSQHDRSGRKHQWTSGWKFEGEQRFHSRR